MSAHGCAIGAEPLACCSVGEMSLSLIWARKKVIGRHGSDRCRLLNRSGMEPSTFRRRSSGPPCRFCPPGDLSQDETCCCAVRSSGPPTPVDYS